MLPDQLLLPQAHSRRLCKYRAGIAATIALAFAIPWQASAQEAGPSESDQSEVDTQRIAFEADLLDYDSKGDIITASGHVILRREGQTLEADSVSWNRQSGLIEAKGNIRLTDSQGSQLFTDSLELNDELKAGAMESMLLVLTSGGRLAAIPGRAKPMIACR